MSCIVRLRLLSIALVSTGLPLDFRAQSALHGTNGPLTVTVHVLTLQIVVPIYSSIARVEGTIRILVSACKLAAYHASYKLLVYASPFCSAQQCEVCERILRPEQPPLVRTEHALAGHDSP